MDAPTIVAENVKRIHERMALAAESVGRPADSVRLVAVTKYVSAEIARELVAAGCRDLGESRPQSLWKKHEALDDLPVRWHVIGHLQTNKVRRTLKLARLASIQSVDRLPLLDRLEEEAAKIGRSVDILLEVRVSSDPAKHGFIPSDLSDAVGQALECKALRLRGLMAMASLGANEDQTRREFMQVAQWREKLIGEFHAPEALGELSMGMSRDFEIAIECGATMVRVGSLLFDGLELP